MAQQLGVLTLLLKVSGLTPSTQTADHNKSSSSGSNILFWTLRVTGIQMVYNHTH